MTITSVDTTVNDNLPGIPNSNPSFSSVTSPVLCGINPAEIYSSNPLAKYILGDNITQNNFISFIITPGTDANLSRLQSSLGATTSVLVTMYSSTDSFSLKMGSSYTSPLTGTGGGGPIASIGSSTAQIGSTVNSTMQALTGISAFNKAAYLPVWSKTEPLSFSLDGIFIATSNPYTQVEKPIEILNMYTCPMTSNNDLTVLSPGPVLDSKALAQLSNSMSSNSSTTSQTNTDSNAATAKTALTTDLSSLFTAADQIFVQIGNTALVGPVVINSVTQKNPNNNIITNTPQELMDLTFSDTFLQFSEVTIEVTCYFPPIFNGGKDYDSVHLFPKPEVSAGIGSAAVNNLTQSAGFFNPPAAPNPTPVFPAIQTPSFSPQWGS